MLITVSRDVIFHEQHFSFHFQSNSKPPAFFIPISTDFTSFFHHHLPDVFHTTSIPTHISHLSNDPSTHNHSSSLDNISDRSSSNLDHNTVLWKSTRLSKIPSHLSDYVCGISSIEHIPHWCNLVAYEYMSLNLHTYVNATKNLVEPSTYEEAFQDPRWVEAMNK